MRADFNLIVEAAAGSAVAQLCLVSAAIEAGASGAVRQIEALIAAETWARMAAAQGDARAQGVLAGVLLARAHFEHSRAAEANSHWYEHEARAALALSGDKAALVELGADDCAVESRLDRRLQADFGAAGSGDLSAVRALYDTSVGMLSAGRGNSLEALTAAEIYARLGATKGDTGMMRSLAGILLKRAEYEYREGWPAIGESAVVEAAVILSILTDEGDLTMVPWLTSLIEDCPISAAATAIAHRPTILAFVEPLGTC